MPRALEMARDLIAHDVGLLEHLGGERIVAARRRLVDDHRQRRLQRMREIADMGARALDDLAVGVDQRVGLARQRRDLDREIRLRAARRCRSGSRRGCREMRLSGARPKRTWNIVVSSSTDGQRQRRCRRGSDRRRASRRRSRRRRRRPRRDSAPSSPRSIVALDQPQPLVLRARRHSPCGCRSAISATPLLFELRQLRCPTASATRALPACRAIEPRDLPVPAGQRQFEQRLAERLRTARSRIVRRADVGDQRAQIDAEPAVERALDRLRGRATTARCR